MIQKLQQLAADKRAALQESEGGFTLIELLVVVVIIGILIAIAIPLYLNYQKGAHDKSAASDLRGAVTALNQCYTDNGNFYPSALNENAANTAYTPSAGPCSSDVINVSSGTTLTYTPGPTGCSDTSCTSFKITAYNSGGNRSSTDPYTYDSTTGGQIS